MISRKKIVSCSLLASILGASLLTACGGNAAPSSVSTQNAASGNTEAVTEVQTEAEPSILDSYIGTDFGGAEYRIGTNSSEAYPNYTGESISGEPINDVQFERDAWLEDHYAMKITYQGYEDGAVLRTDIQRQVKAGDTTYDLIEAGMTNLCPLSSAGMLLDLKSVEGLDLSADWWSQSMNRAYTINDRLYTTTGPITFSYYYSPRVIAFNLRLAADHDIGDLYSVVDSGKWTLDKMADIMKDFSADLDGDGKMGEDDLWAASVDNYSAAGFFISAGGTQTLFDSNGKPYFVLDDEKNVAIIDKVASIIGNADMTQKAEELANRNGAYDIRDKVYTFKNGNALFFGYGAQAIALYLRDMKDDYGIIPVPKYDESQTDYITFGNIHVPAYIGIPCTNDLGSMNGIVLDSMGYISRRDVQPLVKDVTLKGKGARDEASQRMLDIIYKDVYLDLNTSFDLGGSFALIHNICMGRSENFVSQWEKKSATAIKALDKLYNQYLETDH